MRKPSRLFITLFFYFCFQSILNYLLILIRKRYTHYVNPIISCITIGRSKKCSVEEEIHFGNGLFLIVWTLHNNGLRTLHTNWRCELYTRFLILGCELYTRFWGANFTHDYRCELYTRMKFLSEYLFNLVNFIRIFVKIVIFRPTTTFKIKNMKLIQIECLLVLLDKFSTYSYIKKKQK